MNYLTRWTRPEAANWPVLGKLTNLRDELDRLFESPFEELSRGAQLFNGGWAPALDVYEDKDNLTVKAELPGMKREDIGVSFHDGTLTISGERKSETKHEEAEVYRSERFVGKFQRTVTLPIPVKSDAVKASYKDGILTVTLPKAEEAKPKQIDINVS
jgi:HSP20 family protein